MALQTPLHQFHQQEGARIVDFAGWDMPVEYTGIKAEHLAVRQDCGLFDLSHMGEVQVSGPGAEAFVQGLVTNDLSRCELGQAQYTCMCNPAGRVLDDMIVYRVAPQRLYLVVNASNRDKIVAWMTEHLPAQGVEMKDLSMETALIAVQGPNAQARLQPLLDTDLESIRYYHFLPEEGKLGVPLLVSRTGYTGEDGFELYMPWGAAEKVWKLLREAGVPPIGLGARDTLRLESGYALYGHEIDEQTTPLEASLSWVVRLDKSAFTGREALLAQKAAGAGRTLVGLVMEGRTIPRQGYPVLHQGREVGRVTSGTYSPSLSKGIAMASVEAGCRSEGGLQVDIRGRHEAARVVRPPFVKGSVRRN